MPAHRKWKGKTMEERRLAFVLSGGCARGAFQAGALRALFENNIHPEILVGTSIGAMNAAFLAVHGFNSSSIDLLIRTWLDSAKKEILPTNINWLALRTILKTPDFRCYKKVQTFLESNGIGPDLRFRDIREVQLYLVAVDLYTGQLVLYGQDPNQSVLEGVLASSALPPFFPLFERDGKLLMDGGMVSNLPVEAAVSEGATEILALDVTDLRKAAKGATNLKAYLRKLVNASEQRHIAVEIALAREKGIPVHHIPLHGPDSVSVADFGAAKASIQIGYDITNQWVEQWNATYGNHQPIEVQLDQAVSLWSR
jgi:NTE family protein